MKQDPGLCCSIERTGRGLSLHCLWSGKGLQQVEHHDHAGEDDGHGGAQLDEDVQRGAAPAL